MRRRSRTHEVPPELVDPEREWTAPGEVSGWSARFASSSPGAELVADVARAAGVTSADLAAVVPSGTTPEESSPAVLVGVAGLARQHAARRAWLDRNVPPSQQDDAFMLMVRTELFA